MEDISGGGHAELAENAAELGFLDKQKLRKIDVHTEERKEHSEKESKNSGGPRIIISHRVEKPTVELRTHCPG